MTTKTEWIEGLRDFASYVEINENIVPTEYGSLTHTVYASNVKDLGVQAKKIGGRWNKVTTDYSYSLERKFGPHTLRIYATRDAVCTKVQDGTETVTIPDPNAPLITVERPVYKWVCPEVLNVQE